MITCEIDRVNADFDADNPKPKCPNEATYTHCSLTGSKVCEQHACRCRIRLDPRDARIAALESALAAEHQKTVDLEADLAKERAAREAAEEVAEAAEAVCLWMDWDMESPANPGKHPHIDELVNAITKWKGGA